MKRLVTILHGSRLHGTHRPDSDYDLKTVFIPASALRRRDKPPAEIGFQPNFDGPTSFENYYLAPWISLVRHGQIIALEMLFSPATATIGDVDPDWLRLRRNADRLVCREVGSSLKVVQRLMVEARPDAAQISILGEMVELLERAIDVHGSSGRLASIEPTLAHFVENHPETSGIGMPEVKQVSGIPLRHLEVAHHKTALTMRLKDARKIYRSLLVNRTTGAAEVKALKDMAHAARIIGEIEEYLEFGTITLPRPDSRAIIDMRLGNIPFEEIKDRCTLGLSRIASLQDKTALPKTPDLGWIDAFLAESAIHPT